LTRRRGIACLVVAAALVAAAAPQFRGMRQRDLIVAGPGVTAERRLAEWLPAIAGGPVDTPVYVLDGRAPGGTVLVLGGTHGDEAAGYLAAVVLVECARVRTGRLIVVPRANASGFTHNVGQEAHPQAFVIDTPGGPRRFTYGARATNPIHQWPDPQVYIHAASGQALSGSETRNLNRAYPGREDGTLTEQLALAITTLATRERADLAIDLHEASPEYPVVNTMVAHERAMDLAALANVALQEQGIDIGLEASPEGLHGLSHREWGDATPALAVLAETTNPSQGRLRGRTDAALVTRGRDRFYVIAAERGRLTVPFRDEGWPIDVRVARHLSTVLELIATMSTLAPDRPVEVDGLPSYSEVLDRGVGRYLGPPTGPGRTTP
jgi:predicted deacylase